MTPDPLQVLCLNILSLKCFQLNKLLKWESKLETVMSQDLRWEWMQEKQGALSPPHPIPVFYWATQAPVRCRFKCLPQHRVRSNKASLTSHPYKVVTHRPMASTPKNPQNQVTWTTLKKWYKITLDAATQRTPFPLDTDSTAAGSDSLCQQRP